jgi:hypothetical protein
MPVSLVTASYRGSVREGPGKIDHNTFAPDGALPGVPPRPESDGSPIVQVPTVEDVATLDANWQEKHQAESTSREQGDSALGMRLDALNNKFETTVAQALGEELREALLAEVRQEVALIRHELGLLPRH